MPASLARSAMRAPTSLALAVLSPSADLMDSSNVDADASVRPTLSSTICTNRCRADRLTTRRGRSVLPVTFLRTRRWRRTRERVFFAVRGPTRPEAYSIDDLLAWVPAMTTYQPSRPCGGSLHPGTARPWPCTGLTFGACGSALRSLP